MKNKKSDRTNLVKKLDFSKKEVFQLDTSMPTIYDHLEDDEEDEFSPDSVLRKYPKTDEGRKAFIKDSLKIKRKLPRSVGMYKYPN